MKFCALLLAFASFQVMAAPQSIYTGVEVKDCITVYNSADEVDPEIDSYHGICPGFGGYVVEVSGGDIRYNLKLYYNGVQIETPQLSAFHDMGSKVIEWRYEVSSGNVAYKALIYRLSFQNYDPTTGNDFNDSALFVIRLNKEASCLIGSFTASENRGQSINQLATALADSNTVCP